MISSRVSRFRWLLTSVAVAALVLVALPAWAQTGSIEGAVKDESGAAMPGVTVDITSTALIERTRSTVSDGAGNYQFLRLPAGTYSVKFSLSGFRTLEQPDIVVNANRTSTINADLAVGSLEETLT